MLYLVKDNTLHRLPVPILCGVKYNREPLRDIISHDVEECLYCVQRRPEDEQL